MPFLKDDYILCLSTRTQDAKQGRIDDETPYGAPNQLRSDYANVLVAAELQELGVLSYIPSTEIDNSSPLTTLSWYFPTSVNSVYRFFLVVVPKYSGAATYTQEVSNSGVISVYADVIYHTASNRFYKAIATNFTAIEPSVTALWENYWVEFTDFISYFNSTKLVVHIHDDLVSFQYEDCLKDMLVDATDVVLRGTCDKLDQLLPYLKAELLLSGAESEMWQNHSDRADFIITQAHKSFCC